MNNHQLIYTTIKSLFISTILLNSLPVFSDTFLTSENTFAEGDYRLTGINGLIATGGGYGNTEGGDRIDTSALPGGSIAGVSGVVGSSLEFEGFLTDRFIGSVVSGADVLDPLNQISDVLADGEAAINFSFNILTPHTYTLSGSTTVEGGGSVSILFDSVELTRLDDTFSFTGTLAAGSYSFSSSSIAALGDTGSALASYDFDLQLNEVPVPAAAWLFASGLIGLIGVSRRKSIKG